MVIEAGGVPTCAAGLDLRSTRRAGSTAAFRLAAAVTLLDALQAVGSSLLDLMRWDTMPPSAASPGHAALILAMHAAGPRLALAASVLIAIRMRSAAALTALGAALALSQALDAAAFAIVGIDAYAVVPVAGAVLQVGALALLDMEREPRPMADGIAAGRA